MTATPLLLSFVVWRYVGPRVVDTRGCLSVVRLDGVGFFPKTNDYLSDFIRAEDE